LPAAVKQLQHSPDSPSPTAAKPRPGGVREMFERETNALMLHGDGLLAGDSEAIHQFRISVRRLRGLLELYQPLLQRDWANRHREELKFLGHSVGSLRDSDVLPRHVTDAAAKVDESLRDALGPLHDALAERRREQHKQAVALLRSARYETLVRDLPKVAFKPVRSVNGRVTAPDLIQPLVRTVKRATAKLGRGSGPAEFHRLRIRIKRLRYALEMLDGKSKQIRSVAKKLKGLQDLLGLQHDLVTARDWLREVTTSTTMPGATLLAAGAVYQVLHRRILKLFRRGWKRSKSIRDGATLRDVLNGVSGSVQKPSIAHNTDAA
jgi:CHAD domain-containing protein